MIIKQAQSAAAAFDGRAGQSSGFLAKAQSLVSQALLDLSGRARQQQAIWELEQLDDHALRDIGISRCEIDYWTRSSRAQARRSSHAEH